MYVGNGECVCDGDMCDCFNEETTGLPFGGTLCECDPSICYSQEQQRVRPLILTYAVCCQADTTCVYLRQCILIILCVSIKNPCIFAFTYWYVLVCEVVCVLVDVCVHWESIQLAQCRV